MAEDFPTEWITTSEAAQLTEYDVAHIRRLVREGCIKGMKRGRDWFLSKSAVLAYTEEMRRLGSAKHDPWRTGARQKTGEEEQVLTKS
jgi:excisionase family DNA binding protein